MTVDIICADVRDGLARFPDGHFHCCVTSPPFWGLRDYGLEPTVWGGVGCEHEWGEVSYQRRSNDGGDPERKQETNVGAVGRDEPVRHAFCRRCNAWRGTLGLEPTPELFCEHLVSVIREVRRVLRPDGTLWLNLGDSYNAAREGGWAGGKHGVSKPENAPKRSGVNAPGLKPKDLVGVPWMVAFALRADGWWLRSDIVWSKPNPMPESVTDRPTRSHEYLFLLTKRERYAYDQDAIREPLAPASIERISQSTFDEQTGGPKDYRTTGVNRHRSARQGLEGLAKRYRSGNKERKLEIPTRPNDHRGSSVPWEDNGTGRNRRTVWEIATQPYPGAHFAVFPEKLVEPCILAGTSEWGCCPECGAPWERVVEKGTEPHPNRWSKQADAKQFSQDDGDYGEAGSLGVAHTSTTLGWRPTCKHGAEPVPCRVLDPFAGSGTVGVVAERLGRHSVLIDAKEEYCEMARHRTAQRGLMVEAAS